jgi:squalene-associated FAD-dependent desaturase
VARRVAIVGAGWAGLAAAVAAVERGCDVALYEATRTPGGRARTLALDMPDGRTVRVDNGQHILIGAYVETLRLMERVGVRPADVLLRLPLVLRDAQGCGLALPDWPSPFDAAAGILCARGWTWRDKSSLLRAAAGWQRAGFACPPAATVAELTRDLTPRVREDLVDPLCVAALNTPAARASGQVFLRVLRDSLFGRGHAPWRGSNLLLPRQDLGRVLPEAATAWLESHGAQVRIGERVHAVRRDAAGWRVDGAAFDDVVLAVPSTEAARLVAASGADAAAWVQAAQALAFEAIATVYATGGPRLPLPMLALRTGVDAPAQFVFDRSQLGGPAGLLAFVVSASSADKAAIESQVVAQARALGWQVQPLQTVVEKRATFACTPALQRPAHAIAPGLWACGDYVDGPYPATLEGAVRSALQVVDSLPRS